MIQCISGKRLDELRAEKDIFMFIKAIRRPFKKGRTFSPVHVRSVGHYIFRKEEAHHILKMRKFFLELFWGVRGEGCFRLGKKQWILKPGEVCFYFPGDTHDLTPVSDEWEYFFLGIDGNNLQDLITRFHLVREPVAVGVCPAYIFDMTYDMLQVPTLQNEYLAGAYAFEILTHSVMGTEKELSYEVESFMQIVAENYADHGVDINQICEQMGIHRATLFRKVKSECGMTPSEYLMAYRIQQAIEKILQKKLSMKEIAGKTGFSSVTYFYRAFRNFTGTSPKKITALPMAPLMGKQSVMQKNKKS